MELLRNTFGTTLLDPNEIDGLLPEHITTQNELNEWEQSNILEAKLWLNNKRITTQEILGQLFIRNLHRKMFGKTWGWAGEFRKSNKNIGCEWFVVSTSLKQLFDDIFFQILHETYSLDEIATRFHHRVVYIHPFPNGNGRLARIVTDLLLVSHKHKAFSWGKNSPHSKEDIRKQYITALKAADKSDYSLLINFVRT